LDVKLVFDDRPYKLGDAIDVAIELSARGEIEVREARLDLVCEEHYWESYNVMVPDISTGRQMGGGYGGLGAAAGYTPTPMIPKLVNKEIRETYVHSSVVFLTDTLLSPGVTDRHSIRLDVGPEPPPHASNATIKWRLEIVADVARARDIKTRHKVNMELA
jgi:hypothetical protein